MEAGRAKGKSLCTWNNVAKSGLDVLTSSDIFSNVEEIEQQKCEQENFEQMLKNKRQKEINAKDGEGSVGMAAGGGVVV